MWSLPHLVAGYLFGRYTELSIPQFTLFNGGFEIFENTVLKKHYDIFNTPFGRETVYESPGNSVMDFLITEAGYFVGFYEKFNLHPSVDYMASLGRQNLVVVEVGCFCGRNALNMFNKLDVGHMYLVDPYVNYDDYDDMLNQSDLNPAYLDAQNRLKSYSDRLTFIPNFSDEAIYSIPDNVDFVYIDGNHGYEYVKRDIEIYYHKLRHDGIIAGHDYANQFPGVIQAVDEFADKYNLDLYVDNIDWWMSK